MEGHFLIKPQVVYIDISFFDETMPVLEDKKRGSSLVYLCLIYGERDLKVISDKTKLSIDEITECIAIFLELGIIMKSKDIMYLQRKVSGDSDFRVSLADLSENENNKANDCINTLDSLHIEKWNTNSFIEYFKAKYLLENEFKTKEIVTLKEKKFINDLINEYGKEDLKGLITYCIKQWDKLISNAKKSHITIFGVYQHRQFLFAEYNVSKKVKNKKQGEW